MQKGQTRSLTKRKAKDKEEKDRKDKKKDGKTNKSKSKAPTNFAKTYKIARRVK
tara:strand:+ start:348 stop:509 length:162 start_codon:yes stop_codon:yes gene_type:complete